MKCTFIEDIDQPVKSTQLDFSFFCAQLDAKTSCIRRACHEDADQTG